MPSTPPEMHVELTSKGEVRSIAAAGAEIKGALKPTFWAKRPDKERFLRAARAAYDTARARASRTGQARASGRA